MNEPTTIEDILEVQQAVLSAVADRFATHTETTPAESDTGTTEPDPEGTA